MSRSWSDTPPRSHVPGVVWPAMPDPRTAMMLAIAWQLDASQWWTPAQLAAQQSRQRDELLAYACATVPHYADAGLTDWASVPILTRDALIAAGDRMLSRQYPQAHGPATEVSSSRTTGTPVRVRSTEVCQLFWYALTLRDHDWHGRDLAASLAAVRFTVHGEAPPPDGLRTRSWGPATVALAPDAAMSVLDLSASTEAQIAWLTRVQPTYLLIYPSALAAMLRRLEATGARLPTIREVRTIGETLPDETRALCRRVLGAPIVDAYSAAEVGYIALQCPASTDGDTRYHVQAERVLVEILGDRGEPCAPGQVGRVVVTDLHNFATPLLRYELGDYAEVGAPCPCGRGLPVLTRIVGRRRGMVTYPDGRTAFPVFSIALRAATAYREVQLVQPSLDRLVLRIVADRPLDDAARAAITASLQASFAHPFAIAIEQIDELPRGPGGKLEEFVSALAPAR